MENRPGPTAGAGIDTPVLQWFAEGLANQGYQRRRLNRPQVLNPQLIGLADWVKRITEAN